MTLFLRIIQHLLPRAAVWAIIQNSQMRQFFDGLSDFPSDIRDFFDAIYNDSQPQTTTQLPFWNEQFALSTAGLTDQEQKDNLEAAWAALGGQGLDYLQGVLDANGFSQVTIHQAFTTGPVVPPVDPIIRNPLLVIGNGPVITAACGEPLMQCGEPGAQCGEFFEPDGILLVNQIPGVTYTVTTDDEQWPFFLYFGDAAFPALANIPAERRGEFEDLILRNMPGQNHLGVLANYT